MGQEDFLQLPDCGPELAARLVQGAREAPTLSELYQRVKTRRYAHARIRRLVLWAFLGLRAADRPEEPAYLKILGHGPKGREVLQALKKRGPELPLLTKPAHISRLSGEAQRIFSLESRCTDLYDLCGEQILPGGRELTTGPVVV